MARRKKEYAESPSNSSKTKKMPPAKTPEGRENQLIAMAEQLAEEKLRDGTASNQLIIHYLRLATSKTQLEKANLEEEIRLKRAKTVSIESAKELEVMVSNAMDAMRSYSGLFSEEDLENIKDDERH